VSHPVARLSVTLGENATGASCRGRDADAFAVVTAQDRGGVVMTGDREFEPLAAAGVVDVSWLPRRRP
jgi:hypothetical protein